MNAYVHSQISVKRRGGVIDDYFKLHDFSDCSKEICSSNAHRLYFHTMWGVKNVMMRVFGHTFLNSEGKEINTKDCCENDHILPDYGGKFIPTLSDFVDCMEDDDNDLSRINKFQEENSKLFSYRDISNLMVSPLHNTGKLKSLFITHNSWFVGEIIPKCFSFRPELKKYSISPVDLFSRLSYKTWMSNGVEFPPSCEKIENFRKISSKQIKL